MPGENNDGDSLTDMSFFVGGGKVEGVQLMLTFVEYRCGSNMHFKFIVNRLLFIVSYRLMGVNK